MGQLFHSYFIALKLIRMLKTDGFTIASIFFYYFLAALVGNFYFPFA